PSSGDGAPLVLGRQPLPRSSNEERAMNRFWMVGVASAVALAGCGQAEPRSQQYFEDNLDEAKQVVDGCRDGSVRGGECDPADRALQRMKAKQRSKRIFGDGKAYTPRQ